MFSISLSIFFNAVKYGKFKSYTFIIKLLEENEIYQFPKKCHLRQNSLKFNDFPVGCDREQGRMFGSSYTEHKPL